MSELEQLQQRFQDYLLAPQNPAGMRGRVVDDRRVGAVQRLNIYADAYRLRLLEALADNYPALHTLLGDDAFDDLGRAYIDAHPSTHFSIRWFGDKLAEFLRQAAPYPAQPVLAEMAAFEWALRGAFDAADVESVTLDAVATLAPEQWPGMRITLHPSVRRLNLNWNVPALWKQIDARSDPQPPQASEYPLGWLIWRRDLQQYFRSLSVEETWALDRAREGIIFADICEGLCEWVDDTHTAAHAADLLRRWLDDGLVAGVESETGGAYTADPPQPYC